MIPQGASLTVIPLGAGFGTESSDLIPLALPHAACHKGRNGIGNFLQSRTKNHSVQRSNQT